MNSGEVVSKVRFYAQARMNIANDRNLTEQGKVRAGANLEQSINLFRAQAYETLKGEWRDARRQYEDIARLRSQAERMEGERWDYNRLLYETKSVETRLRGFPDFLSLGAWVQAEMNSGNRERSRAVAETVPSWVRERFPGLDGERLLRAVGAKLGDLLNTPELAKVKELESEGGKAVMKLLKDTEETARFFQSNPFTLSGNEFFQLMDNVRVSREIHPDTPQRFETTTIEFTPEPVSEPAGV